MAESDMAVWPGRVWLEESGGDRGVDYEMVRDACSEAAGREVAEVRDMAAYLGAILASQSHRDVLGPLRDGAGASGVVIRRGYVIDTWGDPSAVEMSFSATKSYLSLLAGVALDRDLIGDVDEPVCERVRDAAFVGQRHERITWQHLLHQTSEWGGTLWAKPYWADPQGRQSEDTPLGEPGTVWAYNDVRINLLALALTRIWQRPLSDVLHTEVFEPIGASTTWQWHGYDNSVVDLDGHPVPVVSGGAHWGGGLWASAYDHARVGYLYLRGGEWNGRQVLSKAWVDATTTPCSLNGDYGLLWWLNRQRRVFPDAPESGFCARGNLGRQLIWVDPERDLVVVSRWTDGVGLLLAAISSAIATRPK